MLNTKTLIKNIIFDLDGTLTDSSEDIISNLLQALKDNDVNLKPNVKIKIGPPIEEMVTQAAIHINENLKLKVVKDFRHLYFNSGMPNTKPYSFMVELMSKLKDIGVDSYIATYKPKVSAEKIMSKEFNGLYKDIMTPSEVENFSNGKTKADILMLLLKKWNLKAEESIMIGDAKSDIVSANKLKIFSIGVKYGYGEPDEFIDADKIVNTTKDLSDFILGLCNKEI